MKIKIKELEFDEDIYPRQRKSKETIESYKKALEAKAKFPPLIVQRISIDKEEKVIVLDGKHRYEAHVLLLGELISSIDDKDEKKKKKEEYEVEIDFWKDEVLDKNENLEDLRIISAKLNLAHGNRLGSSDFEYQCFRIVRDRPVDQLQGVMKYLSNEFGVTPGRISQMGSVVNERNRRTASRDSKIYCLKELGWLQEEIAKKMGMGQSTVSEIIGKFSTKLSDILKIGKQEGKLIKDLSEQHGIPAAILWHKKLDGKKDEKRFSLFADKAYYNRENKSIGIKIYDIWRFAKCDPRLGVEHPGRIPGQALMSLLYYYTNQGDWVLDIMAGGGVTNDACLVMGRKCHSYDIDSVREDIIEYDIENGIPDKGKKYKLIFWDPPYWNLMAKEYTEDGIAKYTLEEWYEFVCGLVEEIKNLLAEDGIFVFAIQPMEDEKDTKEFIDLTFECVKIFQEEGLDYIFRISQPNGPSVKSHHDVEWAKKNKKMLIINRDFVVFKK